MVCIVHKATYLGKLLPLCSSWPSSTGSASFLASSASVAAAAVSAAGVSVTSLGASASVGQGGGVSFAGLRKIERQHCSPRSRDLLCR